MLPNLLRGPWLLWKEGGTTLVLSGRGGDFLYIVKMVRCDPDDPFPGGRVPGDALL